MASEQKRAERRRRHQERGRERGGSAEAGQREYATAGEERESIREAPDRSRDPKTLSDFDPAYGHTHATAQQGKGSDQAVNRASYGRGAYGTSDMADSQELAAGGGGNPAYGETYGQGFGVGAGHGAESAAEGLEGSPRERDYRGNAGVTFGATVGPDALKEDTSADKRPDPKPEE